MQKKSNPTSRNQLIIYGKHAVVSALKNPRRNIQKLLTTAENSAEFKKLSPNAIIVDRKEIDKLLPRDAVHQGVVLYSSPLENTPIEQVIKLANQKEKCHVLILDQVTDPQNIGAIIRSCAAFNAIALIVQDKNSPEESGSMIKAAAGTIENMPICRVTNLSRAIEQLQNAGFWVIGMDGKATETIDKINNAGKNAIIMGNEGKGMRRLVEENCDMLVKLPISSNVESLNVSTAAAIALYEMNKGK